MAPFVFVTAHVLMEFSEVWAEYLRKFLTFKNGRRQRVSDGSDIDYVGNELGSNFGSSSISISSESNLDERHVVVLVKLFATVCATGERCVNMDSKSVRLKLSRFPRQGSWVERDFNQLVTAAFQGICEANSGRECVGLQLLQPVLPCRNRKCVVLLE